MENDHKELQLLPTPLPYTTPSYSRASPWPSDFITFQSNSLLDAGAASPSLDLQLSITIKPPQESEVAAAESAYARRVMEMTRREMEMAQMEFARARHMWERAREEVEMVEKMKEKAMRMSGSCMEITCQACRRKFRP